MENNIHILKFQDHDLRIISNMSINYQISKIPNKHVQEYNPYSYMSDEYSDSGESSDSEDVYFADVKIIEPVV